MTGSYVKAFTDSELSEMSMYCRRREQRDVAKRACEARYELLMALM